MLALLYGQQAIDFIETHSREVGLAIVGLIVLAVLAYWLWRKLRARPGR